MERITPQDLSFIIATLEQAETSVTVERVERCIKWLDNKRRMMTIGKSELAVRILAVLGQRYPEHLTASELAAALVDEFPGFVSFEKSVRNRLVGLVDLGYVEKNKKPECRRSVQYRISQTFEDVKEEPMAEAKKIVCFIPESLPKYFFYDEVMKMRPSLILYTEKHESVVRLMLGCRKIEIADYITEEEVKAHYEPDCKVVVFREKGTGE